MALKPCPHCGKPIYEKAETCPKCGNQVIQHDSTTLDKNEVKTILAGSGVANEKLEVFDRCYDETAGERTSLLASNVMNTRSFEVKTPDVVIKVNPERTDLIETRNINGRDCLVIELGGSVVVNGITVRSASEAKEEGYEE